MTIAPIKPGDVVWLKHHSASVRRKLEHRYDSRSRKIKRVLVDVPSHTYSETPGWKVLSIEAGTARVEGHDWDKQQCQWRTVHKEVPLTDLRL